jgi:hypothetical protein
MSYRIEFEPERNLLRKVYSGEVHLDELIRANTEEWADSRFREGVNVVCNFRAAHVQVRFPEMTQYADFLKSGPKIGNQAIVVNRELDYGTARMFELLTEGVGPWTALRVFYDEVEAEAWIDAARPRLNSETSSVRANRQR